VFLAQKSFCYHFATLGSAALGAFLCLLGADLGCVRNEKLIAGLELRLPTSIRKSSKS
jgi:hypothetical protein